MVSSLSNINQNTADTPKSSAADPSSRLANEQTFLQLLVAQMKNQNPLNPTDSMQFVSQLAQFSQLEQMIAVRQDADVIRAQFEAQPQI
jgi:flagellar basal-body rod modification protein FlgD